MYGDFAQMEMLGHKKYLYSFTDARSRYSIIYFRNTKDKALKHIARFKEFVETQTSNKKNSTQITVVNMVTNCLKNSALNMESSWK